MAAATGRPRLASTRAPIPALVLLASGALAACAGDADSRRSGPPGGGVDPSSITSDSLSMGDGAKTANPERVDAPSTADATTGAVDVPSPSTPSPFPQMGTTSPPPAGLPSTAGTAKPAAGPPSGAKPDAAKATGSTFTVTAAHCQQIGRKLGQLASAAGGTRAQSDAIGNEFTSQCTREKVGTPMEKRELDCLMAMKSIQDAESCR